MIVPKKNRIPAQIHIPSWFTGAIMVAELDPNDECEYVGGQPGLSGVAAGSTRVREARKFHPSTYASDVQCRGTMVTVCKFDTASCV